MKHVMVFKLLVLELLLFTVMLMGAALSGEEKWAPLCSFKTVKSMSLSLKDG